LYSPLSPIGVQTHGEAAVWGRYLCRIAFRRRRSAETCECWVADAAVQSRGVTAMKTKSAFLLVPATAMWLAQAAPATADLIGTQVSGSFFGGGVNLF